MERSATIRSEHGIFDFTAHMDRLVAHVVATCPELGHIRLEHVLVCCAQCRRGGRRGVQARVVPLRFPEGAVTQSVGQHLYQVPPLTHQGRDILYLIYFYLPRFLDAPRLEDKLATVCHELYHISPACDGDLRRFPGRAHAHGPSRQRYHTRARAMAQAYLAGLDGQGLGPAWFLQHGFAALQRRQGPVVGRHVPLPKVRRVV